MSLFIDIVMVWAIFLAGFVLGTAWSALFREDV